MSAKVEHKTVLNINNDYFIAKVSFSSKDWTWYTMENRNEEKIHLPLAITFSRICGFPVFRFILFKLLIELAIKRFNNENVCEAEKTE